MKNKDKYKLSELDWRVTRVVKQEYLVIYQTKIYLCKDAKKYHIATLEGGAHSDLLNWLESEARND